MARKRLGEILVQAGVLDDSRLRAALSEQRRWGGALGRILIDMHLVSEEALVQALSHQLNFPVVNLDPMTVPDEILELVPADLAESASIVPFNREGKFLDVAMSDPMNLGIIDELRIRTQLNVRSYLAGPKSIERAILKYYGRGIPSVSLEEHGQPAPPSADGDIGAIDFDAPKEDSDMRAFPQPPPPVDISGLGPAGLGIASGETERDAEIRALQERISKLEALVARDESVLRKVLALLVEKGIASRQEILERIK